MRLFLVIIKVFYVVFLFAQDFNILEYGAVPGGKVLNTTFIQQAIDDAAAAGGGRVIISRGTFLTGAIVLKSGVELRLENKAVLLGSTNPDHYFKLHRWLALILAEHQSNMAITGKGEIDGQGRKLALHIDSLFYAGQLDSARYNFVEMRPSHYIRPQLIEMVNCTNIRVQDVTLRNAACWVQTYDQCRNVLLDGLRVESDAYWNNDGIDIQDCRQVRITNCFVNAADDGICLKSQSATHLCDSILIENCTVRSSASAVKFGTVSHGGFRNVVIRNIKVYDTFRSAIAIECVDGGILENVLVEKMKADNVGNAIFIRLGDRNQNKPPGILRNITIRQLKASIAFERPDYNYDLRGPSLPFFHNVFPASITGIPGAYVEDIILEDIRMTYPGRGNDGLACMPVSRLQYVPEKESAYPEYSMFGELPAWGFYVRHVKGIVFGDVIIKAKADDYRPAVVLDDVYGADLRSAVISGEDNRIILSDTKKIQVNKDAHIVKLNSTE